MAGWSSSPTCPPSCAIPRRQAARRTLTVNGGPVFLRCGPIQGRARLVPGRAPAASGQTKALEALPSVAQSRPHCWGNGRSSRALYVVCQRLRQWHNHYSHVNTPGSRGSVFWLIDLSVPLKRGDDDSGGRRVKRPRHVDHGFLLVARYGPQDEQQLSFKYR